MTESKSSYFNTLNSWVLANQKLSFFIGLLLVYILQSFVPSKHGYVYYEDNITPVKNAWVVIKYIGDEYTYLIGNGLTHVCVDAKIVKTNSKGGFIIPALPFYHSLRYYKDAIHIYGHFPEYRDDGEIFPRDISKYGTTIKMKPYIKDYDKENRLVALLEIAQYKLCGKAFWNEISRKFYKALYDEAKLLVTTSSNPYRFRIPRKICNIAIGDPINEPRADECPWLRDEY